MRLLVFVLFLIATSHSIARGLLEVSVKLAGQQLTIEVINKSKADICVLHDELPVDGVLFVDVLSVHDVSGKISSQFTGIEPSVITDGSLARLVRYITPQSRAVTEISINEYYDVQWNKAVSLVYGFNFFPCGDVNRTEYFEALYKIQDSSISKDMSSNGLNH